MTWLFGPWDSLRPAGDRGGPSRASVAPRSQGSRPSELVDRSRSWVQTSEELELPSGAVTRRRLLSKGHQDFVCLA